MATKRNLEQELKILKAALRQNQELLREAAIQTEELLALQNEISAMIKREGRTKRKVQ